MKQILYVILDGLGDDPLDPLEGQPPSRRLGHRTSIGWLRRVATAT